MYEGLFAKEETITGSCADYQVGAGMESRAQEEEIEKGRYVGIRTLVLYSQKGLGSMSDVEAVWKAWVDREKEVELKVVGLGDGYGHYLPEECPGEVITEINKILR